MSTRNVKHSSVTFALASIHFDSKNPLRIAIAIMSTNRFETQCIEGASPQ
jgi:hypothetical protein